MRSLVVIALIAVAAPAAAQPRPSKADIAEAKQHFKAAEAARARSDWDTAIAEYLAAYAKFPDAEFYFNIGEVYRRKGDDEHALEYFQKYLELDPKGRGAATARTAVDELGKSLEARKQAAAAEAARQAEADAAARRRAQASVRPAPVAPPITPLVPAPSPEQPAGHAGRGLRIGGLVSAGIGVAALGAGVYFGLRARKIDKEAAGWEVFDADRYAEGEAAERNAIIAISAGGAAVVAGGVLYYLGHRRGKAERIRVAPLGAPGAIGVAAGGSF